MSYRLSELIRVAQSARSFLLNVPHSPAALELARKIDVVLDPNYKISAIEDDIRNAIIVDGLKDDEGSCCPADCCTDGCCGVIESAQDQILQEIEKSLAMDMPAKTHNIIMVSNPTKISIDPFTDGVLFEGGEAVFDYNFAHK